MLALRLGRLRQGRGRTGRAASGNPLVCRRGSILGRRRGRVIESESEVVLIAARCREAAVLAHGVAEIIGGNENRTASL